MMLLMKSSLPYIAFAFAFALPFTNGINNYILALFYFIVVLLVLFKQLRFQTSNISTVLYSTLLLMIPFLWAVFFVENYADVLVALERRLSFILTPIAFLFLSNKDILRIKETSLKGLTIGAVLSSVLLIVLVLIKYYSQKTFLTIDNDLFNYFHTNSHFTNPIDIHPSYLGLYLLTSVVILLFTDIFVSKVWKSLFVGLLSLSLIFLNSRIVLGLYFILIIFYFWQYFQSKFKNGWLTAISTVTFMIVVILVFFNLFKNTYLLQRIKNETTWELTHQVGTQYNKNGSGDSRLARWDAALHVIKQRPFIGHGISMETEVLKKQYIKMGLKTATKENYNSHNQFLGFAIEGGIISLILFCFFLLINLYFSLKSKDFISLFFFVSIATICLVENLLVRNAGITFVSFFSTIFLFFNLHQSKINSNKK
jgi:O-antigen ligase